MTPFGIGNFDRKKALEVLRKVMPPNEAYYLNNKSDIELILLLNTVKSRLIKEKNNIVTEQTSKLEGKLKSLRQLIDTARKIKEEIGREIPEWILSEQLEDNINFTKQEITPRLISFQDWESKVDGFTQKIELEFSSSIVASIVEPIKNGRFSLDLTPLESLRTQRQSEIERKEKELIEKYSNIDFASMKRDTEDIIQKIDTLMQDLSILKKKRFLDGFGGKLFGISQKVSKIKENALDVVKTTSSAFYTSGAMYRKICQYDKAIAKHTRAIKLNPNSVDAYNERGICYGVSKQRDKAIADYTEAVRLDPKEAVYYRNRGLNYQELNEHNKAIADFTETIKLNPNYADAYNLRGESYYESNQYDKALSDFEMAISLNPKEAVYYKNRVATYLKLGQDAEAERDFTKARELRFFFSELTVLDKEAKLIWTRDANIAGKCMAWNDAFKFIDQLNIQRYAGYSDWRLPSKEELETLVDYARSEGVKERLHELFKKIGFKNVKPDRYWSSTELAHCKDSVYAIVMWNSYSYIVKKTINFEVWVWPVRAEQ